MKAVYLCVRDRSGWKCAAFDSFEAADDAPVDGRLLSALIEAPEWVPHILRSAWCVLRARRLEARFGS